MSAWKDSFIPLVPLLPVASLRSENVQLRVSHLGPQLFSSCLEPSLALNEWQLLAIPILFHLRRPDPSDIAEVF